MNTKLVLAFAFVSFVTACGPMDVATRENAKAVHAVEQAHSPTIENLVASVGGEHAFSKVALSRQAKKSVSAADTTVPPAAGLPDFSNIPGGGSLPDLSNLPGGMGQPSVPNLPSIPGAPAAGQLPDLSQVTDGLVDLIDQNANVIGDLPAEQKAAVKAEIGKVKEAIAGIDTSQLPAEVKQFIGANDEILAALERALGN